MEKPNYHCKLGSGGNSVKDSRHHKGLLHLQLHLILNGEGRLEYGRRPVAQDHLFVKEEDGVGVLEVSTGKHTHLKGRKRK